MSANKSITERIFQAIGFELLAILICTPLLAWIMTVSYTHLTLPTNREV